MTQFAEYSTFHVHIYNTMTMAWIWIFVPNPTGCISV